MCTVKPIFFYYVQKGQIVLPEALAEPALIGKEHFLYSLPVPFTCHKIALY